jgi:hypothetical protein
MSFAQALNSSPQPVSLFTVHIWHAPPAMTSIPAHVSFMHAALHVPPMAGLLGSPQTQTTS